MKQWLCVTCWRIRFPGRRLAEVNAGIPVDRDCARCGNPTRSGLLG